MKHQGLDHFAIAVANTDDALQLWRDTFGFPVLYSEVVNDGAVKLTHLDLGNTQLQLVEPLLPDHPLHSWIAKHGGAGLHHVCLKVEDIDVSKKECPVPTAANPHQGTRGKRAIFLDARATQGTIWELTGR